VADLPEFGDETLARLRQTNGLTVAPEYFDAVMRTLTERFLKQPTLQELRFKTAEDHYASSVAARESGNWATSEQELTKAIELNPGRPDYFQNRAAVRVKGDDLNGALLDINQAMGLDPTSQQLAIDRFHILQAMDRLEDALSSYRQWAQSNGVWENDLPF
jgi:tetratricopeptide (TPR) repeat protein